MITSPACRLIYRSRICLILDFRILLLMLFFTVLLPSGILAQEDAAGSKVTFGPRLGINIANVTIDPELSSSGMDSRVGLVAGAMMDVRLNDPMTISAELLYIQAGYETRILTVKSDYLAVPLSLKYHFSSQANDIRPFVMVGAIAALNINAAVQVGSSDYPNDSNTSSGDMSAHIGFGSSFRLSSTLALVADGRYSMSFTDAYVPESASIKARNFIFSVGLMFPL